MTRFQTYSLNITIATFVKKSLILKQAMLLKPKNQNYVLDNHENPGPRIFHLYFFICNQINMTEKYLQLCSQSPNPI